MESRVSNPELCLPRLTLPTTGSKSLNFQDPSHIPKASSLSSVHSIFINYLSFVVYFKQTYFNCLFFLCRVAGGSLLNIYICCVYFPWKKAEDKHLEPRCMKSLCFSSQDLSWVQTCYGKSFRWMFPFGNVPGYSYLSALPLPWSVTLERFIHLCEPQLFKKLKFM